MEFDYDNPWHRHANLYFCIVCERCLAEIRFGDLPVAQQSEVYEELCVSLSELAQSRGWRALPDGWSFLCPLCSVVSRQDA
jgi:hypothetical protein